MDAARYFEMMHCAMSARKRDTTLLLRVKVQDLGGADAYLELRQEPGSGRVRVFYSTMGRRNLNFQLFRKGWQLCHNASGEMTGRFPAKTTLPPTSGTMPLMQAGPSASCTSCAAAPATTPPPCPATRGRGRSSRWTAL